MGARKAIKAEKIKAEKKQKAIAILRDCPTSPRKMRLVADIIRGVEINKGRANANKVLAAALQGLPVTLCSIAGGSKDNAIPRTSEAVVVSEADDFAALFAANAAKAALPETEQHAEFYCEPAEAGEMLAESEAVLGLLNAVPNGVQAMSSASPALCRPP